MGDGMNERRQIYETGVIHGRFQIFHNDHLHYILSGKALCKHLVVGITNPDPFLTRKENADPTRSDPPENPLTYYERYIMVQKVLLDANLDLHCVSIVPFPINFPELYQYYLPTDAVFFLSIYDDWGRRKLHYFQSLNLAVHVLREVNIERKGISAGDIRQRMITDQPWEHLVPACLPPLIHAWGIPERLKKLRSAFRHK